MRIDRDAAPVIGDRNGMIGVKFQFDPAGMAGHGLVHRIVQHLGHQVMQGTLVGAADIHSGAFSDRFQPFQHLDVGGGIGRLAGICGEKVVGAHERLES